MNATQLAFALSIGLFVGMLACLEAGYRLGSRPKNADLASEGLGTIEAAVFALLGLLLAFSFSAGLSRLDARHRLIVQEANAIGTAYLRLDLLPAADQPEMRHLFREYLDARIGVFQSLADWRAAKQALAHTEQLQQTIWSKAVTATRADQTQTAARLLLPALNEMIDVTTSRTVALFTHVPPLIFVLLIGVALLSGFLGGLAMARRPSRSWLHMLVYAMVVAITIYAVADLDYPRAGLIRVDAADSALAKLRDSIR
jgi:hypothetical protein